MRYKNSIKSNRNKTFKSVFIGLALGLSLCAIFLLLFSFILLKLSLISDSIIYILTFTSSAISSLVSSYITVRMLKHNGLVYGALIGFLLFFFFTFIGFFISREPFSLFTLVKLFIMIFMGALGGIISANK